MPELPEVETVVRGLKAHIQGAVIRKVCVLRANPIVPLSANAFCRSLQGKTIKNVTRRAKYLIFHLDPKLFLVAHLRMTGKFIVADTIPVHNQYHRVQFDLGDQYLIFEDIRCFGTLAILKSLSESHQLARLGVEPLSSELTGPYLKKCFEKTERPIKNVLMDQRQIAGIGNIYASEILFEAKISPLRSAKSLQRQEINRLIKATQYILQEAIVHNGTSISDFRRIDDQTGEFQNFLRVYNKAQQPCPRCNTRIQRIIQQQRSSFFCSACQT